METRAEILFISSSQNLVVSLFFHTHQCVLELSFIVLEFKIIFHKTQAQLTLEQYGLNFTAYTQLSPHNKYVQYGVFSLPYDFLNIFLLLAYFIVKIQYVNT